MINLMKTPKILLTLLALSIFTLIDLGLLKSNKLIYLYENLFYILIINACVVILITVLYLLLSKKSHWGEIFANVEYKNDRYKFIITSSLLVLIFIVLLTGWVSLASFYLNTPIEILGSTPYISEDELDYTPLFFDDFMTSLIFGFGSAIIIYYLLYFFQSVCRSRQFSKTRIGLLFISLLISLFLILYNTISDSLLMGKVYIIFNNLLFFRIFTGLFTVFFFTIILFYYLKGKALTNTLLLGMLVFLVTIQLYALFADRLLSDCFLECCPSDLADSQSQVLYWFFGTIGQVYAVMISIIIMLGVFILSSDYKDSDFNHDNTELLKKALEGFAIIYASIIIASLLGLNICSTPSYLHSLDGIDNKVGNFLFEYILLSIIPSMIYTYELFKLFLYPIAEPSS